MSAHPIVHIEIPTQNPTTASEFYSTVFGWKIEADAEMDYVMFDAGNQLGGGFPKIDGEMFKGNDLIVYIDTDDIEATLATIEAHGGKALLPKTEIPTIGWFAFFADPSGNRMALYKSMRDAG